MSKPAQATAAISTPAYARLRDHLRGEILSGAWAAGTHRTLADLATLHGTSFAPVREALLILQGEGLLEMRAHRGAVVPVMSARLFEELYDLRGSLQSLLARRAAERATADHLAQMARHADAHADAAARQHAADALTANEAFHEAIEAAADVTQVASVYRARSAFVNMVRLRLGFGPERMAQAAEEHRAILAAIAAGAADAAADAAFAHCMAAKRDLIGRI
jgi:DNA-binding GntR family transcriptional regulator